MRILAVIPALLIGACQVSSGPGNNQTTVQLSTEAAENSAEALLNEAEQAASNIANRAERVGEKIENKVGDVDVDVDVGDRNSNSAEGNAAQQ